MKQGFDHFEATRVPPDVAVCERRYVVNVKLPQSRLNPEQACPPLERPAIDPFIPKPTDQQIAEERIVSPGPKTRAVASTGFSSPGTGLQGFGAPAGSPMTGLGYQQ